MKKSYLLIAAAAGMMLAACSQEDDFVAQNAAAQQGDGAVLFDTYLSNNSTRAGQTGTMTTTTLQQTGFGVMAVTHNLTSAAVTAGTDYAHELNFMWNQYVGYEASNWIYSPLKYWPNETATTNGTLSNADQQAAQAKDKEGVSFFAYAPYVNATPSTGVVTDAPTDMGITALTSNAATTGAKVTYKVADGCGSATDATKQPSKSVDLLWGTSSGFSYHPVSTNSAEIKPAGLPVINMEKPGIDEKIKFDFKHALARIGMTVVGAFDQVAAGGTKAAGTKVTIKEITVTGTDFGINGVLNLNNGTAGLAKWESVQNGAATPADLNGTVTSTITIDNGEHSEMNSALTYNGKANFPTNAGVYSSEQNVISAGAKYTSVTGVPPYSPTAVYYSDESGTLAVANYTTEMFEADGTGYKKLTAAVPVWKAVKNYYSIATPGTDATITHAANADKPAKYDDNSTELANGDVLYTKSTNDYVYAGIVGTNDATLFGTGSAAATYYKLSVAAATPVYASGSYYTRTDVPGYFMVIPYNRASASSDATVTVKITYYVTTYDANLKSTSAGDDDTVSQIENVISQDVVLKDFNNGKSYNLKLILGLTSVKVEAEVSNWEVGTVESNLPQNLE